ncbi:MAG TPA: hypothetical protein VGX25_06700 [Actinophytocola sp.]|uniref:hypothetical protein n=1 Tax=Actinophytocola sp. TaxID=1872138 RepID=UPI002DDD3282|nr:hypothetical protein [Actinophytocola sp.]HEV2779077.1 hypothetical protein [Actinophytocola sp.]
MGILLGNLLTGTAPDLARAADLPALPWIALTLAGAMCVERPQAGHDGTPRSAGAAVVD